jgi:hypothetical protein
VFLKNSDCHAPPGLYARALAPKEERHMCSRLRWALAALAPACGVCSAQPINVLTYSSLRAGACGPLDFGFATGNAFDAPRAALLSPATAAVLGRPVTLRPPVDRLTPASLAGVDVVLIPAVHLDCGEAAALAEFLANGGGLFCFGNLAAVELGPTLGATPGGLGAQCAATVAGAPVGVAGPFGTASGCICPNYHLNFLALPPSAVEFLDDGAPVGAAFTQGPGRAVLICDEEWMITQQIAGCAIGTFNGTCQTVFLNAFAHVVPAATPLYQSTVCYANCDCSTAPPRLNVLDFNCFLNRFAAGCP